MRILVTGADGFVGTHLVRELAGDHEVIAVDKTEYDLAVAWMPSLLVQESRPDYVVHLAARYGRILCRDEPHRAVADNAASTTELAAACAERGIPMLYTSTSEVYGDHGEDWITERSELKQPTTIYGLSKRWGEEALRLYMPDDLLCIVRPNMLYGPGQRGGYGYCALATFIACALDCDPLVVHRGATRSWLYITDAVRALRLLIESGATGTFNMGNEGERVKMLDLATSVVEYADSTSRVLTVDAPSGQILQKNYDSSKLRAAIGWEPEVDLRSGLAATVEAAR